ncbi:MAG TPA: ATP-grasp domain-containing protein [Verrucomicrobiota bacterium]|nr:ATP-grasp domain-containing protein [Verrucomicrobiota bacterium]
MNDCITVLVIGLGSHVSQGIVKALAKSSVACRIVGTCLSHNSAFLYLVDAAHAQPRLEENPERFKKWLVRICHDEGVAVILTGIEPVVRFLSQHRAEIEQQCGAVAIVPSMRILDIAQSKLETCRWLQSHGFQHPRYTPWSSDDKLFAFAKETGYPIVAKPIYGRGSQGIHVVEDSAGFECILNKNDYVFQEYVGTPENEYTVGCFRSPNTGLVDCIVMKRLLQSGFTTKAEVVDHRCISQECRRLMEALDAEGSCNFQLRIHKNRPCVFEINARLSGTTPIRAHFGFNDVEANIRHFLWRDTTRLPKIVSGLAFRYWNEVYVTSTAAQTFAKQGVLHRDNRPHAAIEGFGRI